MSKTALTALSLSGFSIRLIELVVNEFPDDLQFCPYIFFPINCRYTQKMLLDEFAESGHGSDKMDFFYLPIDFKNKCNRGYAFVNFVDYRDIASFHHQYNGKQWKVFNSDKICDISYARIQGKAAMLKRFQNSSLMNQDEDYKPVAFVSSGPRKGEREDFPSSYCINQGQPHSPHGSSLAAAAAAPHM